MPPETNPPGRRRVVLSGAAGRIGRAVSRVLGGRWDLVLNDRQAGTDGIEELDVTDVGACRVAFAGADAVVHLAANRHAVAELEQTRRAIGCAPVDDAWDAP